MQNSEHNSKYKANQVWNTDINIERNRKNTRTAFAVLGVGVALFIVLVVCVALYLPRVMSFSMDGIDWGEIDLAELLEPQREPERPAPEPDFLPVEMLSDGELDFLDVLTAYAIELSYVEDWDMEREIHQMFYPDFESVLSRKFSNDGLYEYAWWMMEQVDILQSYELDRMSYNQALYDLSTIVLTLNEGYDFLGDLPDVVAYYTNTQLRTDVLLEVDTDVYEQLSGQESVWSEEHNCEVLYYTNSTPYTLDLQFTIEFETEDTHYSDLENIMQLQPGDVAVIPQKSLSKLGDQEYYWSISWEILDVYIDGVPIEDYFQ